jgi:ketosteroid isomerase-like protein
VSRNTEITRAAFEAWNRDDLDGWLESLDPEVEFYPAGVFPDFDQVYRGREGLARWWHTIHEPWRELRADLEDIEERGDCLVVS